jgi:hypothetical protein
MASMTFDLVQQLLDRLTLAQQAQVVEYLAPKIAHSLVAAESVDSAEITTWDDFFRVGDSLSDAEESTVESMTAAVISMRR